MPVIHILAISKPQVSRHILVASTGINNPGQLILEQKVQLLIKFIPNFLIIKPRGPTQTVRLTYFKLVIIIFYFLTYRDLSRLSRHFVPLH